MAEHVPHLIDSPPVTATVGATAVTGGMVVALSASPLTVIPAGAASTAVLGVAARDGIVGAEIPVYLDGVHDLTASANVTVGDLLTTGANGQVAPIGANVFGTLIGKALATFASGAAGRVQLLLA